MREENYFEKKLEICKETLSAAERKVEHLDIQMANLQLRFDHDKKIYNEQTKDQQLIIKEMKERIPKLEKQIEKGFKTINIQTGEGYKSFEEKHIAQLEALKQDAINNYNASVARNKAREELTEKKKKDNI